MKKNAKIFVLISVIFAALVLLLILLIYTNSVEQKKILSKCPDYSEPERSFGIGPGMADISIVENCAGSFVVYNEDFNKDMFKYRVYDFKHHLDVAQFQNARSYKIVGNFLYAIDDRNCGITNIVFMNSTSTSVKCLNESNRSLYRKANTESGNVMLYKNFSEMSGEDKIIFQSIPR